MVRTRGTARPHGSRRAFASAIRLALVAAVAPLLAGCNILLPAHRNSMDLDGEKVTVKMLTIKDIKGMDKMESAYNEAFHGIFCDEHANLRSDTSEGPVYMQMSSWVVVAISPQMVADEKRRLRGPNASTRELDPPLSTRELAQITHRTECALGTCDTSARLSVLCALSPAKATELNLHEGDIQHRIKNLSGAAVGIVVDVVASIVKDELGKEADRYEGQFGKKTVVDGFWELEIVKEERVGLQSFATDKDVDSNGNTVNSEDRVIHFLEDTGKAIPNGAQIAHCPVTMKWRPRYYGFEIVRTTTRQTDKAPSFRMVFGLAPSRDGQFYLAVPIAGTLNTSKAKVLASPFHSPKDWFVLPLLYRCIFNSDGDHVKTEMSIELEATWRPRNATTTTTQQSGAGGSLTGTIHDDLLTLQVPIAAFPVSVADKKLCDPGDLDFDKAPVGWFPPFPVSYDQSGLPVGQGTGTLKILVTQKDPSNAKAYVQKMAETVEKQKDEVKKKLQEAAN